MVRSEMYYKIAERQVNVILSIHILIGAIIIYTYSCRALHNELRT